MAVFAHPDDEIGAAGTLALHAQKGDRVMLVWMTRGELASQFGDTPEEEVARVAGFLRGQSYEDRFAEAYGADQALRWWVYWRVFFMSCAELFGYRSGREWIVSHYLFERR